MNDAELLAVAIELVVALGAFPLSVPHTRPVRLAGRLSEAA